MKFLTNNEIKHTTAVYMIIKYVKYKNEQLMKKMLSQMKKMLSLMKKMLSQMKKMLSLIDKSNNI